MDLNLSGAFGGLRITNPDATNDASPPDSADQKGPRPSQAPTPSAQGGQSGFQIPQSGAGGTSAGGAGGLLDFDPASYSTDSYADNELTKFPSQAVSESDLPPERTPPVRQTYSPSYPPLNPPSTQIQPATPTSPTGPGRMLARSTSYQNGGRRSSAVPQAYSAAAASAAAAAMRHPQSGRPSSTAYGSSQGLPPRDGSYRLHREPSQPSLSTAGPRRVKSTSRKTAEEAQAGVLINEDNHKERNYGSRPPVFGGNVAPPRRQGSRGMLRQGAQEPSGAGGGSNNNGTGVGNSNKYMAGSPYAIEGGPPPSSEESQEKGAAVRVTQTTDADGKPVTRYVKKGVKDFKFGQLLGEGSYSQVHLAQDRTTLNEYAIKVLDKRHIIKEKKVKYVNIEKDTLNRLTSHPGVVKLWYTFQDERSLYFVLDCAANGELLGVLKRMGTFDEECTRFYAAQLLDTIEYMHSRGVIHRDLKPENILLDNHMHTKVTDFGTAKLLSDPKRSRASSGANNQQMSAGIVPDEALEEDRADSFVGTAEYVSPELLTEKSACKASDLWAFGCIVYQLLAGRPPFKAGTEYLTFRKIIKLDYRFPPGFPSTARDLIERCLVLDPRQRLTIEHIKNHEFFRGMKFGKHLWQQKAPTLKPYVPVPSGPIRLNSQQQVPTSDVQGDVGSSYPPDIQPSHSVRPVHLTETSPRGAKASKRPSPRVITDVPPPSQLDIEWSPILAKDNERILKLGNLAVIAGSARDNTSGHRHGEKEGKDETASSTGGGGGAFRRFFTGGTALKKKTRMVMVTTNGRLLIANGPDEKKLKFEVNLLAEGSSWMKCTDSKGLAYWCLETKEKHFTFEDPKHASSDVSHTTTQVQEWLDALDRARDTAVGRSATGSASGYSSLLASPIASTSPTRNFGMSGNANDSTSAFSASNFSIGGQSAFTPGSYSATGSANDLSASRYAPGNIGSLSVVSASATANVATSPSTGAGGANGLIDQATNAVPPGSSSGRSLLSKQNRDGNDADNEDGKSGVRGFRRFSKRSSKSGLAAVF